MSKRSKKKKRVQTGSIEDKIDSFLSRFGITKPEKKYKESGSEILDREGIDHKKIFELSDEFSAARHNLYFTNKETSIRILAGEYQRYAEVLKALSSLNGVPKKPKKICDIGAGPAITSLWLAQMYPESLVTAIDYSENALKTGKNWADELGLKNIDFKLISYEEAAIETITEKFDFIFGTSFVDLHISHSAGISNSLLKTLKISDLPEKDTKPIQAFIKACKNLVSENGIIYLDIGAQNSVGLLTLLNFAKECDLGIDWHYSNALITPKQGDSQYCGESIYLFLCPGLSSFVEGPWEDLLALKLFAEMTEKPITLTPVKFETYFNLLSDGLKIIDIDAEVHVTNSKEKFLCYSKAGLLGFFRISEKFGNSGIVHSVCTIYDFLENFKGMLSQVNDMNFNYLHPLLSEEFEEVQNSVSVKQKEN